MITLLIVSIALIFYINTIYAINTIDCIVELNQKLSFDSLA